MACCTCLKIDWSPAKNIWFVKCDLSEEAMPKPQDASNKERCE